jgi:BMFP domain-containing protein YqiC
MSNPKKPFEAVAKQLLNAIPMSVRHLPQELEKQFHDILQKAFVKMDLVTREEFDAQVRVLRRMREKLATLEKKLETPAQSESAVKSPATKSSAKK